MKKLLDLIKQLSHIHKWRGMEFDEWQKSGGYGTPDWICEKCGERRYWSGINISRAKELE